MEGGVWEGVSGEILYVNALIRGLTTKRLALIVWPLSELALGHLA